MDLSADIGLKMAYVEKTLTEFWCEVEKEYSELGKHALNIKNRQRNRLDVEKSLVPSVSILAPELSKVMKDKQTQVSH